MTCSEHPTSLLSRRIRARSCRYTATEDIKNIKHRADREKQIEPYQKCETSFNEFLGQDLVSRKNSSHFFKNGLIINDCCIA